MDNLILINAAVSDRDDSETVETHYNLHEICSAKIYFDECLSIYHDSEAVLVVEVKGGTVYVSYGYVQMTENRIPVFTMQETVDIDDPASADFHSNRFHFTLL